MTKCCCRLTSGVSPTFDQLLSRSLVKLCDIFPGTDAILLMRQDASVVYHQMIGSEESRDMASVICSLKRAALQLSVILGQCGCPSFHVKGVKTVISCYDAGSEFLLAIMTTMTQEEQAKFDMSQADTQVTQLLDEVRLLLTGSM